MTDKKEWLTTAETAAEFGRTEDFWRDKAISKELVAKKDKSWLLWRPSVEAFMLNQPQPTMPGITAEIEESAELKEQREAEAMRISKANEAEARAREAKAKHEEDIIKLFGTKEKYEAYIANISDREQKLAEGESKIAESQAALEHTKELLEDWKREQEQSLRDREKTIDEKIDFSQNQAEEAKERLAVVAQRRADLNVIEDMHLQEREAYTSLVEKQRRTMPIYRRCMVKVANVILKTKGLGVAKIGDRIWDNIEEIDRLKVDFDKNAPEILNIMKADIRSADKVAIELSHIYEKSMPSPLAALLGKREDTRIKNKRDDIIDNLEAIVKEMRELKPPAWSELTGEDEMLTEAIQKFMRDNKITRISSDDLVAQFHAKIDDVDWLLRHQSHIFYQIENDQVTGHTWGLVKDRDKVLVNSKR